MKRRELFRIIPAGAACAACPAAAGQAAAEKADVTWEQMFRFAYQKDFVPVMQAMSAKLGRERFVALLRETVCEVAAEKMKRAPIAKRDFATFRASMRQMPPVYRAALDYDLVEDSDAALEYRVKSCLWARMFREMGAGEIGSAYVCAADFAIARAFHPKLKLEREKTLMEGQECCHFKYTMEG